MVLFVVAHLLPYFAAARSVPVVPSPPQIADSNRRALRWRRKNGRRRKGLGSGASSQTRGNSRSDAWSTASDADGGRSSAGSITLASNGAGASKSWAQNSNGGSAEARTKARGERAASESQAVNNDRYTSTAGRSTGTGRGTTRGSSFSRGNGGISGTFTAARNRGSSGSGTATAGTTVDENGSTSTSNVETNGRARAVGVSWGLSKEGFSLDVSYGARGRDRSFSIDKDFKRGGWGNRR